jgi:hypothetical protein
MTRKTGLAAFAGIAIAAAMGGRAAAAPQMGQFAIDANLGYALMSTQDIKDIYGPSLVGKPAGGGLGLAGGFMYNVGDSVQLGVGIDYLVKKYTINWAGMWSDIWTLPAMGYLGRARFIIPGSSKTAWYAISLSLGVYSLSGAQITDNVGGVPIDLKGSKFGGIVGFDYETSLSPSVALTAMIGYRFAKITPVTAEALGTSVQLFNYNLSKSSIDFSGLFLQAGFRFYFGGNGSGSAPTGNTRVYSE